MFSFSIQVPKFNRRRSQPPPKERRATVIDVPAPLSTSSRSRSIGTSRRRPSLVIVDSEPVDSILSEPSPIILDISRNEDSLREKKFNSLPARIQPQMIEISPGRGRRRSRHSSQPSVPLLELPDSTRQCEEPSPARYEYATLREVSSDSRGRHVVVERSRSRRPRSSQPSTGRGASSVRSVSRSPRVDVDSPIIHQTPERARSRHRRSVSRQSRVSCCSCSPSDGGSSVFTASTSATSPSVKSSPDSLGNFQQRLEKLATVNEPPEEDRGMSPSRTVTRYKYRYAPYEDDVSSVKSFVRELERGRARSSRSASVCMAPSPPVTSIETEQMHLLTANDMSASHEPRQRRTHARSYSHNEVNTVRRTNSFVRLPRSSSIAPSMSTVSYATMPSQTTSVASYPPTAPRSSRDGRPKFSERFSVCLDESFDGFDPALSVVTTTSKDSSEDRRMRRMRRVVKMAEFAAGKR